MILDNLPSKMITSIQDMINQIEEDFIMPSLEEKKELSSSLTNTVKDTQESDIKDLGNTLGNTIPERKIRDKESTINSETKSTINFTELSIKLRFR